MHPDAGARRKRRRVLRAHTGYAERCTTRMERLNTADAALYLGKPVPTLRWWRHKNLGPRSYLLGRSVVYDRADLDAWLADQKAATVRGGK